VKRVLLVDDDDDLREALSALLLFGGYDVAGVASGADALAWLAENGAPDLILLDLMMPGMTGAELKARLDGAPPLRHVPVLVISGDTRLPEKAAAMGASGWICKPAPMEALLGAVARCL
jgi:CheY-like chemotaxis protein